MCVDVFVYMWQREGDRERDSATFGHAHYLRTILTVINWNDKRYLKAGHF